MIRAAPKLKLLHKWGIGVDKFDLDAARAARVPVAITFGANAGAVSEHTLMLMLATYRRLSLADRKLREGSGCGRRLRAQAYQLVRQDRRHCSASAMSARMVAHRLAGFDVEILYHDIRRADMATEKSLRATPVSFDELLERSDVVSRARAADPVTRGMIDADDDGADEDRRDPDQCRARRDCR